MHQLIVFAAAACNRRLAGVAVVLLGALFGTPAPAQKKVPSAEVSVTTGTDPCKAEVLKFEETIAFIRQSQGNQAAEDLKKRLIPPEVEAKLLATEGYCGLAKHIREKKLNR
ncbi:MAG: hypothetical protein RL302_2632 [Pseudomonadota bacterium]|jgi:hypothetical protein